jgi:hypothetical protein
MTYSEQFTGPQSGTLSADAASRIVAGGLLNPELDLDALATAFADQGKLQIEDALRPEVADILFNCLDRQVPWCLTFRDRSGPRKMWPQELAAMPEAERADLEQQIREVAVAGFQFRYDSFMMVSAYKEKRYPELVLHRVIEQINQRMWLEPMRRITGFANIRRADAQATRYVAGHFLRPHDDVHEDEGRLAAYVINLTRDWHADWGGLLQFLGPDGAVTDTFMPRYNTISMFRVPAEHCVSPVASFVPGARYAITGWMRT